MVLELGSASIRGGLAGRHHPAFVLATTTPARVPGDLRLAYLELLTRLFTAHLHVRPKECQVVVVEKVTAARVEREHVMSVLLKDLQVQAVTMQIDLCMSLLANGSADMTGLVIDIGHTETRMMAVAMGRPLQQTLRIVGIGVAHALEAFRVSLLEHLGQPNEAGDGAGRDEIRALFEKVVCARPPDGQGVQVSPKQWLNGGKAFDLPASLRSIGAQTLIHGHTPAGAQQGFVQVLHAQGLAGALASCAAACNHDVRRACTGNVVFSGGGAMIPQLAVELCDAASAIAAAPAASVTAPRFVASDSAFGADAMAWTGASLFATLKSSQARFVGEAAQGGENMPLPDWQSLHPDDWTFCSLSLSLSPSP